MDTISSLTKRKGLNATQIKTIAIIAMLIDHIAWRYIPTYTLPGQLMHVVGRLTAPIMCYFIAQGYLHTRNFKKYLSRMVLFSLISHIPYNLETTGRVEIFNFSVMHTLTLGLIAIYCYDKIENKYLRWLAIAGVSILAIPGDWSILGIAFCLIFFIYRDNFKKQFIGILCTGIFFMYMIVMNRVGSGQEILTTVFYNLFQLSILLSLPILRFYNGEKGGNSFSKWSFYIFYPLHLLVLALI